MLIINFKISIFLRKKRLRSLHFTPGSLSGIKKSNPNSASNNCHFNSQIPWYQCKLPNPRPSNLSHASHLHKSINLSIKLLPKIFYLPKTIISIAAGSRRNRPYLSIYTHPFQTPDCEFPCMTNGLARFTYWHFRRTQNFNLEIQLFKPPSLLRVFPRFVRKMKFFKEILAFYIGSARSSHSLFVITR